MKKAIRWSAATVIAVVVFVSTYEFHQRKEAGQLRTLVGQTAAAALASSERGLDQAALAIAGLRFEARNGCSEDLVIAFRDIANRRGGAVFGFAGPDGALGCTTFGASESTAGAIPDTALGRAFAITIPTAVPPMQEKSVLLVHAMGANGHLFAAIPPEALLDDVPASQLTSQIEVRLSGSPSDRLASLPPDEFGPLGPLQEPYRNLSPDLVLASTMFPIEVALTVAPNVRTQSLTDMIFVSALTGLAAAILAISVFLLSFDRFWRS